MQLDPAVHGMGAPLGWLRRNNEGHPTPGPQLQSLFGKMIVHQNDRNTLLAQSSTPTKMIVHQNDRQVELLERFSKVLVTVLDRSTHKGMGVARTRGYGERLGDVQQCNLVVNPRYYPVRGTCILCPLYCPCRYPIPSYRNAPGL